jgi:hypothetical protein
MTLLGKGASMFARYLFCAVAVLAIGCGSDEGGDDGPLGGSLTVTGDVVDFQTDAAIATGVAVMSAGISPPPTVSADGSMFTMTDVPEYSVFQILASATDYRPTYSSVVEVTTDNLSGVKAPLVKNTYIDAIATAFGVTPTAGKGIAIVKLVDANGAPRAGVPGTSLILVGSASGPYFLDAQGNPAVGTNASSASGLAVWFEVTTGTTEATQAATSTVFVNMAASPVAAGTVTLGVARVTDGAPPVLPTNVSFANQIVPIFTARGCVGCHAGNGPGRDLGGLALNGGTPKVYSELVEEKPNTRVNTGAPALSLVLTKPLAEQPPNHQTATFANQQDPDYLKLFVWIKEGAKNN